MDLRNTQVNYETQRRFQFALEAQIANMSLKKEKLLGKKGQTALDKTMLEILSGAIEEAQKHLAHMRKSLLELNEKDFHDTKVFLAANSQNAAEETHVARQARGGLI